MSDVLTYPIATGRLVLSQGELVALAEEVGAERVRGLDGWGLLHAGVDPAAARAALEARGLDRSRADLLGAAAAWVRQRLALLRLDEAGQRAALILRHEADRLVSHLVAAGPAAGHSGAVGVAVSTVFDQPVAAGPLTTLAPRELVVEELDPAELTDRAWRATGLDEEPGGGPADDGDTADAGEAPDTGDAAAGDAAAGEADAAEAGARALLPRPFVAGLRDAVQESAADATDRLVAAGLAAADASALVDELATGPLPLVRLVAWRRTGGGDDAGVTAAGGADDGGDGVSEVRATWLVGRDRLWLVSEAPGVDVVGLGPDTVAGAARTVAAAVGEGER
ncbi:MAG TPA: hypothetical protein VIL48_17805 [Acidimicrobiales bacterium]